MKVQITTLKDNKLLREFADDKAFLGYVEFNSSKIKNIEVLDEATLPELQKAVEVAKPSMSKGWGVLPKSAFGSITSPEKADSVGFSDDKPIATEFRYEPTQPSDKAVKDDANDKVYLDGAKTEQPKVDQEPAEKEVKPEPQKEAEKEDKDTTVDTKEEKVSTDTPEKEKTKENVNESAGLFYQAIEAVKKDWNDVDKDEDKLFDICVNNAELFGIDPNVLMKRVQKEEKDLDESVNEYLQSVGVELNESSESYYNDLARKNHIETPDFYTKNHDDVSDLTNDDWILLRKLISNYKDWQDNSHSYGIVNVNGKNFRFDIKDKDVPKKYILLTRIYNNEQDNSINEGLFGFGAGSKEDMEKALIIAYVKGLERKTIFGLGMVTKKDLANFDEYKRKYDEYMGNNSETIEAERTRVTESIKNYDHSYDDLIGKTIRIIDMAGEPDYAGKEGVVEHIDDIGQLHGTWGGLAVQPENDRFEVIEK